MKFLILLLAIAFAVPLLNPQLWPEDYACQPIDLTAQTVVAPTYTPTGVVAVVGDYLDATFQIRGDYKVAGFWASKTGVQSDHSYNYFPLEAGVTPVRAGNVLTWTYYPTTTADTIVWDCSALDCAGNQFCTVSFHLHIGHLNHWGFRDLYYNSGTTQWETGATLWFNIYHYVEMFPGAIPLQQDVIVAFPIELTIRSTYDIQITQDLTVYGTQNLKASLVLFKEYPYTTGAKGLDLKFAFSVQYPYEVETVRWLHVGTQIFPPAMEAEWQPTLTTITEDLTLGTPRYKYQYVSTTTAEHYTHSGQCVDNNSNVKWDGSYELRIKLKCRDTLTWCELPASDLWWQEIPLIFTITSNNICPKTLTKDPVGGKITFSLVSGQTRLNAVATPNAFPLESNFVADDFVYFMIKGSRIGPQVLRLTAATLNTFTFTDVTLGVTKSIWSAGAFNPALPISPSIDCQPQSFVLPLAAGTPTYCYTFYDELGTRFYFPAIGLGFKLVASTFNLVQITTPHTFSAAANIKFDYDFFNPTSKRQLQSVNSFSTSSYAELGLGRPSFTSAPVATVTSNAGVVVGSSVGAVVAVAALVAFLVVRNKRKNENHAKLNETTA